MHIEEAEDEKKRVKTCAQEKGQNLCPRKGSEIDPPQDEDKPPLERRPAPKSMPSKKEGLYLSSFLTCPGILHRVSARTSIRSTRILCTFRQISKEAALPKGSGPRHSKASKADYNSHSASYMSRIYSLRSKSR